MAAIEIKNVTKYQNQMVYVFLTLAGIHFLYIILSSHSWSLPKSILVPIAENVPAIGCALKPVMHYRGEDRQEILAKAGRLYYVYGFTVFYGMTVGSAFLIWWFIKLRHLVKLNHPITYPPGFNPLRSLKGITLIGGGFLLVGFLVLRDFSYQGDCDIIFKIYANQYKPGAVKHASGLWVFLFFSSFAMYIFTMGYLIFKKENCNELSK